MSISKIKSFAILGGISLMIAIFPFKAKSQVLQTLNPDSVMHDNTPNVIWYPEGTNMISFQGNIFLFTFTKYITLQLGVSVYTINSNSQVEEYNMGSDGLNYFTYPDIPIPTESNLLTNTIPFIYNDQLWHYSCQQLFEALPYGGTYFLGNFDCFSRVPMLGTEEPITNLDELPTQPEILKRGAFQHDSSLYFLARYVKSSDPNYNKWCLQKYSFDENQNKFILQSTTPITNIPGDHYGGCVEHIDASGRHRLLINTYTKGDYINSLGYLDATTSGNQTVFTYTTATSVVLPYTTSSVLLGGSIKGCRSASQVSNPSVAERFTIFGFKDNALYYQEYLYSLYSDDIITLGIGGGVVLPSSMSPYTAMQDIQGTFQLVPTMFHTNVDKTADGFQQNNWIYYPDIQRKICGVKFTSDQWKYIPDSTVSSHDLSNDSLYGPEVRDLWTLIGIIDGGPPCSIDWPTWDANHPSNIRPTFLKFITTTSSKTEVSTTYEDQYTLGAGFKTELKHLNFGIETKFSDSYKNKVSKSTTITKEIEKTFQLNEESQKLGVFIYLVPSITRYLYSLYPWWDNTLSYPIPNSYQYRFVVTGNAELDEYTDLKNFPFNVNEPNAGDMGEWRYENRLYHKADIEDSHLGPASQPTWSSPGVGDVGRFKLLKDSVTENEHKMSYSVGASFSAKKPDAFVAGVSAGNEVSYSTSNVTRTEIGTQIQVSLENLTQQSLGVNISELLLEAYWFRHEDYGWWFYDSLGVDEKPWYIAYMVSDASNKVNLASPLSGEYVDRKGMLFSWNATGFVPRKFDLLLSSSPQVTPSSILMCIDAGTLTNYYISELPANVDKLYWTVMAVTTEESIVWSESRPLILGREEIKNDPENNLKAIPYPNPLNESSLHLLIDTKEKGEMLVRIYSVEGRMVYQTVMTHDSEGAQTYELPQMNLSRGMYILEASINKKHAVKKLAIL